MSDDFIKVGKRKKRNNNFNERDDDDNEIKDEHPSVEQYKNQNIIENKMEELLYSLKDYTNEMIIPIGENINVENLIEFFYPDFKRIDDSQEDFSDEV